jgi:hypothetical protein
MEIPEGIEAPPGHVWHLKKSLYGLKQAAEVWYQTFRSSLLSLGFHQLLSDSVVFVRGTEKDMVIVGGHVDDLKVIAFATAQLSKFRTEIEKHFKVREGSFDTFLGVQTIRDPGTGSITIHQQRKIEELLHELGFDVLRPVSTPMQTNIKLTRALCPKTEEEKKGIDASWYRRVVGSCLYLSTSVRPDIQNAVKILAEAMDNPSHEHVNAATYLLRYLSATKDYGITYYSLLDPRVKQLECPLTLHAFSDATWADDLHDGHSRSGMVVLLAGGAIAWESSKQNLVATSSTYAEYIGQDLGARNLLFVKQFIQEIGFPAQIEEQILGTTITPMGYSMSGVKLFGDNLGAQSLARNPVNHKLSKHFLVKYHHIRDWLEKKMFQLQYVPTTQNTADIMTKALDKQLFERHRSGLGMRPP